MNAIFRHPILLKPAVRQFVKFCIVGASSFMIDFLFFYAFHHYLTMPVPLAKTLSFCIAVTNGYYWNRRWTFRAAGFRRQRDQYAMFFAVNVVGLVLNVGIVTVCVRLMTGEWNPVATAGRIMLAATLVATAVVVFWNFFANRFWTFRGPAPSVESSSRPDFSSGA